MNIFIASDHAGFEMKESLKSWLSDAGHTVKDFGALTYDKDDDYPDFVVPLALEMEHESGVFGVVLGKTGQGEAMCANRHKAVRAMVYNAHNTDLIFLAREHNDANVISIGTKFISLAQAREAIQLFIDTEFSKEERHIRRLGKLNEPGVYPYGAEI